MSTVSIVIPVYNEKENITYLYRQLRSVIDEMNDYRFEIIFVDDGSNDGTAAVIRSLAATDHRVRAIVLARNFGHMVALTCGLDKAEGQAVISMDGDGQHPPGLIPELIAKWQQGYDVVQTIRRSTDDATLFKRLTSSLFYALMNRMTDIRLKDGSSDFRLLDRKVVLTFRRFRERARFIRGLVKSLGYRQAEVEFTALARHKGKSKYSLKKMLHFALDAITAYSRTPLRLAFYLGLLMAMLSFGLFGHVLYIKIFTDEAVPGWATVAAGLFLLNAIQLAGIGVIGEYTGRIFEEVKRRPMYFIDYDSGDIDSGRGRV
ncbi:MAG: glycosyltransferase family 2 protein [Negativicutes bacterium]|nr:glycosyltransferase family 2 protein [Negativicutes bacterium]